MSIKNGKYDTWITSSSILFGIRLTICELNNHGHYYKM